MWHRRVFEYANDMRQRVHFAELRQRRGFPALFADNTAHIHVLDRRVSDLFGLVERRELIDTRLWNPRDTNMRRLLARARVQMRLRQNLEERGLAGLWKSYDPCLHGPASLAWASRSRRTAHGRIRMDIFSNMGKLES